MNDNSKSKAQLKPESKEKRKKLNKLKPSQSKSSSSQKDYKNSKNQIKTSTKYSQLKTNKKSVEEINNSSKTFVEEFQGIAYQIDINNSEFLLINGTIKEITGYSANKFLNGKISLQSLIHTEDFGIYNDESLKLITNPDYISNIQYRIINKNGSVHWVRDIKRIIKYKKEPIFQGTIYDVTDCKKAEQLLKETVERFRLIFQISPEAITLSKYDTGEFIDVNDNFVLLTGLSREDIIGKNTIQIGLETDKQNRKRFLNKIDKEQNLINYETRLNLANNEVRTCLVSSRITDYNSEKHLISIFRDISDIKATEEKIRNLNIELEQRVHERTGQLEETLKILRNEYDEKSKAQIELIQAKEDLAKALNVEKELSAMKSSFISMISHEYRTPLTVILSSSEILRRYCEISELEAKYFKHLDNINESVHTMTRLLENILVISKSEASSLYYESTKFNIVEFLVRLIHEIEFSDKGVHHFKFEIDSETLEINSDQKLLKQVLFNIIINAVKFSNAGTEIISSVKDKGNTIEISVRDFGIGIPIEDKPYIYDTFFRCKNSGSMRGSGIGLSVVKRCIDILKGKIEVESEINHGTIFKVILLKNI